jgi:16S rRNA (cytosine1402-N4)-methyltransferase
MSQNSKPFNSNSPHQPVLLDEVLEQFSFSEQEGYFIDCTLGYSGHSFEILEKNPNLSLIGIDRDSVAIEFSKNKLQKFIEQNRVEIIQGSYSEVFKNQISEKIENLDKPILGILADIGVSSLQLDDKSRGFSFASDNLDMRMSQEIQTLTGSDVVNRYSEIELEEILREFGEIRNSKKIASAIVNHRKQQEIISGHQLSDLVAKVEHKSKKSIHVATQVFQAIRIEVNSELTELSELLNSLEKFNQKLQHFKTKIGIISFHSLEDRIVKQKFKIWKTSCICPSESFRCECGNNHSKGTILTKRPITASQKEIKSNPRSRSSKMRVFQFGNF